MSVLEAVLLIGAAFLAGAINTVVGSGSLITFPTLLALGYSPVVANVSNTVGITFGSLSGAIGYRRELGGQRRRTTVLGSASLVGGVTGGILLLTLPSSVFDDVVPVLILLAVTLVVLQPRLSRFVAERRTKVVEHGGFELWIGIFLTGIYGGYFGAAQGVILLALFRLCFADDLQRLNGLKNALVMAANGVAALLFVAVADVAWEAAALIAVGSVAGAQVGAKYGRRLHPEVLRWIVVIVGTIVAVVLFVT